MVKTMEWENEQTDCFKQKLQKFKSEMFLKTRCNKKEHIIKTRFDDIVAKHKKTIYNLHQIKGFL